MTTMLTIVLSVILSAQLDSTQLWIGDQSALHLEATASEQDSVRFPHFTNTLQQDIEVVEQSAIDTTATADGRTVYHQDLVITSFKDSLFYIDPIPFVVNGDTMYTNSLSLNVIQPFEMDTTDAITDIKNVMRPKVWWWGIFRWVLLAILIVGLVIGIGFLIEWLQKFRKQEVVEPVNPETLRPCDEVALEKLDRIKEEKAWQSGEYKRYFSELTFVVREYIGRRYDIHSTEKTSNETLVAMKPILAENDQKSLYQKLESMLQLADLVKFAKWSPTPDESETSLTAAYLFVKETAQPAEKPSDEATDDDFEQV